MINLMVNMYLTGRSNIKKELRKKKPNAELVIGLDAQLELLKALIRYAKDSEQSCLSQWQQSLRSEN